MPHLLAMTDAAKSLSVSKPKNLDNYVKKIHTIQMKKFAVTLLLLVLLTGGYFTYLFLNSLQSLEERQTRLIKRFEDAKLDTKSVPQKAPVFSKSRGPLRHQSSSATAGVSLNPNGILDATNAMRTGYGAPPLKLNPALSAAAIERARHMFRDGYFDHEDPEGKSFDLPIKMTGYQILLSGENIALGNFPNSKALVKAWYNSPGHKKNLLFPGFSEIGIAAVEGKYQGTQTWISVQLFATPRASCTTPDLDMKSNIEVLRSNNLRRLEILEVYKESLEAPDITSQRFEELQEKFQAELERFQEGQGLLNEDVAKFNQQVAKYNECIETLSKSYQEFKPYG